MHINLLPQALQRRRELRQVVRRWTSVWAVVAVFVTASTCLFYEKHKQDVARIEARISRIEPLQKVRDDIAVLNKEVDAAKSKSHRIEASLPKDRGLEALARVARSVAAVNGAIVIRSFGFTDRVNSPSDPNSAGGDFALQSSVLNLGGVASDDEAISSWLRSIRVTGAFSEVLLHSTTEIQLPGGKARQFEVECRF